MSDFFYSIPLKELVFSQKGVKPLLLRSTAFKGSIPYLDIDVLESGEVKEFSFEELGTVATENDVLVVWDGSRSGLALKAKYGAVGSTLMALTPVGLVSDYLFYFLKSKYDYLNKNTTGTGIPHVASNLFFEMKIPYTSIEVQQSVVNDLTKKLADSNVFLQTQEDIIRQVLEQAEVEFFEESDMFTSIVRFRESILLAAFSGDLTQKWRDQNKVSNKNWDTVSLGSISRLITSGSRDWTKYYSSTGARFIRTQDIRENYIDKAKMIYVKLPENVEGKRALAEEGDLLFTIVGSNIGKVAFVDKEFTEEAYVNQAIALVKLIEGYNAEYLHLFFQSPRGQIQIKEKIYGDAQPDLSLPDIRNLQVPLPSKDEQLEIIRRTKKLLELTSQVRLNYEKTLQEIINLEKAILEEAFDEKKFERHGKKLPPFLDVLSECRLVKERLALERKNRQKRQQEFKKQHFMENTFENIKNEIVKKSLAKFSDEDIAKNSNDEIYRLVKEEIPDLDFDDFSSCFQDLAQEKIKKEDDEPFFVAVKSSGKLHFRIRKA